MVEKNHKVIEKKILPKYFQAVWDNTKPFELRADEDDIQVGDCICLKEWDGEKYTGSAIAKKVSYVLRDCPQYGLMDGYCIIGLKDYENEETRQD